jgi:putative hydrolase of the HAD superfamily
MAGERYERRRLLRKWIDPDQIRAVLLDAGNTLVFLDYEAISEAVRESGHSTDAGLLERAEYRARRRVDQGYLQGEFTDASMWKCYFTWLMEEAGVPAESHPQILERLKREHEESNLWRCTKPEVHLAMERLKASGRMLAVISNSDGTCRELLHQLDLLPYLEAVFDSAEIGVEKPDERIFQFALGQLEVRPDRALYMGDLEAIDVRGARRSGILPVLADPYLSQRQTDFPVLRSVAELPDALGIGT